MTTGSNLKVTNGLIILTMPAFQETGGLVRRIKGEGGRKK
jgi:hypothetical protein